MPRQRIGLLGGSFNPSHEGHIHLSIEAKKRLKLDKVIWLVSPQNPLKSAEGMTDYETRLAHARTLTEGTPFITVTDYEKIHGLYYSIDSITSLQNRHPRCHFVWLMGADNLANFHRWRGWREILARLPIAVFDRAPFSHHSLRCKAALSHQKNRVKSELCAQLPLASTPAWCYLFMARHPQSGTHLRKTLGDNAFL